VTPIDTETPGYDYTPLHGVTDGDREAAVRWAESYTGDYTDRVSAIVGGLWPDGAGDWKETLRAWVDTRRAEEEARKRTAEKRRENARQKVADYEASDAEYADYDTVKAAVEALDVRAVAEHYAAEWDTAPGRTPPRFNPSWRASSTGESCFADRDKFVDVKEDAGGGAVKLAALAHGIIRSAGSSVRGEDFRRAVAALRADGFDVPLLERKGKPTLEEAGFGGEPEDAKEAAQKFLAMQELNGD
jgi:putative DNA primase/helicase